MEYRMNMTVTMDDSPSNTDEKPGAQLAFIREKKGFSQEYVAGKLHLRVKVIQLLEADDYQQMPEAVFIKGYFRAYAKLLGVAHESFLLTFNTQHALEKKPEKALWQSKRESNRGELLVRWVTGLVAVSAITAVCFWWQKNKEVELSATSQQQESVDLLATSQQKKITMPASKATFEPEKLSSLSRMQSMFSAPVDKLPSETNGG